ncbi:hypothetical protein MALL_0001 [Mycoplasmopsis alligatoris A21JP2]|uniref:Uncharacterized protein n=1 Tax=Mycoplasmopsis alligatoris A21JP2 TaxID=747682 RepID=D4XVW3_9BACT|nr:hypothetical protein MALL_0001 [Mycoplasmopsis alligatoris A21JP2]
MVKKIILEFKNKKAYGIELYNNLITLLNVLNSNDSTENNKTLILLNQALKEADEVLKNKNDYTEETYLEFLKEKNKVENILKTNNELNDDLKVLHDEFLKAKKQLIFDNTQRDIARLKVKDFKKNLDVSEYDPVKFAKLQKIYKELEDKTNSLNQLPPSEFSKLFEQINSINNNNFVTIEPWDQAIKNIKVIFYKDINKKSESIQLNELNQQDLSLIGYDQEKYNSNILSISKNIEKDELIINYEISLKSDSQNKSVNKILINGFYKEQEQNLSKTTIALVASIGVAGLIVLTIAAILLVKKFKK